MKTVDLKVSGKSVMNRERQIEFLSRMGQRYHKRFRNINHFMEWAKTTGNLDNILFVAYSELRVI